MRKLKISSLPVTSTVNDGSRLLLAKQSGGAYYTAAIQYKDLRDCMLAAAQQQISAVNSLEKHADLISQIPELSTLAMTAAEASKSLLDKLNSLDIPETSTIIDAIAGAAEDQYVKLSGQLTQMSTDLNAWQENCNTSYDSLSSYISSLQETADKIQAEDIVSYIDFTRQLSSALYSGYDFDTGAVSGTLTGNQLSCLNLHRLDDQFATLTEFIDLDEAKAAAGNNEEYYLRDFVEQQVSSNVLQNAFSSIFANGTFEITFSNVAKGATSSAEAIVEYDKKNNDYIPVAIIDSTVLNSGSVKLLGLSIRQQVGIYKAVATVFNASNKSQSSNVTIQVLFMRKMSSEQLTPSNV